MVFEISFVLYSSWIIRLIIYNLKVCHQVNIIIDVNCHECYRHRVIQIELSQNPFWPIALCPNSFSHLKIPSFTNYPEIFPNSQFSQHYIQTRPHFQNSLLTIPKPLTPIYNKNIILKLILDSNSSPILIYSYIYTTFPTKLSLLPNTSLRQRWTTDKDVIFVSQSS